MQDILIKELTSQLSRIEPLARTGQNVALHFLTREAADEEKRAMEQDMARLQDVIKQKDATIAERNKRVAELEQLGSPCPRLFLSNDLLDRDSA